jgi:hypothetical protein
MFFTLYWIKELLETMYSFDVYIQAYEEILIQQT